MATKMNRVESNIKMNANQADELLDLIDALPADAFQFSWKSPSLHPVLKEKQMNASLCERPKQIESVSI